MKHEDMERIRRRFIVQTNDGIAELMALSDDDLAREWAMAVEATPLAEVVPNTPTVDQRANASPKPGAVDCTLLIAVIAVCAAIGFAVLAEPHRSADGFIINVAHAEQDEANLAAHSIEYVAEKLTTSCWSVAYKYGWALSILVIIVMIKLLVLRESVRDVLACLVGIAAFLLLHTVEVVRYIAHEMKRLSQELRAQDASPDAGHDDS